MRRNVIGAGGIACAGLLAISLVGCATDSGGATDDATSAPTGPQTLTISWTNTEVAGLRAVVAEFESSHPNVTVSVNAADTAPYQAALRSELSAGTAADVVWAWNPNNAGGIRILDQAGYLEDLSDRPWVADYQPGLADQTQSEDGRTLIMAPLVQGKGVIYNQTLLDELGVKAPEKWSDVWAYCDAVSAKGIIPFAIPGGTKYGTDPTLTTLASQLVYGDPATGKTTLQFNDDLAAGKTTFPTNKGYIAVFEQFQELVDSNCVEPNISGVDWNEADRLLASGEAAAAILSTNRIAGIQKANPKAQFLLKGFDSDDNPKTLQEMVAIGGGAAIPAAGKNKELALEFVDFLAANARVYWSQISGTASSLKGVLDGVKDPNVVYLQNLMEQGIDAPYITGRWCPEVEAAMLSGSQAQLVGSMTPMQVLESMQAAQDAC